MNSRTSSIKAFNMYHIVFDRIGCASLNNKIQTYTIYHILQITGKDVIFFPPVSSAFPHLRIYFDCIDKRMCLRVIVFETNLHKYEKLILIILEQQKTMQACCIQFSDGFFMNTERNRSREKKGWKRTFKQPFKFLLLKISLWGFDFKFFVKN